MVPTPGAEPADAREAVTPARASDPLLAAVYDELRAVASSYLRRESAAHTLQTTALVHEAWLRLCGRGEARVSSRGHFLCAAALAMRRILVDHAARRRAGKRGGGAARLPLDEAQDVADPSAQPPEQLLALNEALERLAAEDPRKAKVVELRYFAGCTIAETAESLQIGTATVEREWRFARAWLRAALQRTDPGRSGPG